ncbi:hypothetical protein Krac_6723 [Ktedonobacter racemifer DSM 44963]|uniref:Uncharacterized protein n=1 Tax=Ktedonobacter racemifer DSM 44963 TaxID=485913 RepID=D6TNW5_KTERA|nr:hypothetical protein Krac_6723 [Ktedonobacter racemifer DSM 44963]
MEKWEEPLKRARFVAGSSWVDEWEEEISYCQYPGRVYMYSSICAAQVAAQRC